MPPRPDVGDERRAQILEAAGAVFGRLGFHGARMDDIAQEAGLSRGALYLYYRSKDAIIAAILRHIFSRELDTLRVLLGQEAPASETLLEFTRHASQNIERMRMLLPIAFEFYAIAGRQRSVREFLRTYYGDFRAEIAMTVQRGIDTGEFRPVGAQETAITILAVLEGLNILWITDPSTVQPEKQAEAAIRLILAGLESRRAEG